MAKTGHGGRRSAGGGFTLTELLIVVGIIVILVGLLIPALGTVRAGARKAKTQSTMTSLLGSVQQFKTDQRRLPGYFTAREVGSASAYTGGVGFTSMENALIELSMDHGADLPAPDADNDVVEVTLTNPDSGTDRTVRVDVGSLGSEDEGPGYFQPTSDVLSVLDGRDQVLSSEDLRPLPDVVDGWGNPILMWAEDTTAGSDAEFAAPVYSAGDPARFYWQQNAGYLNPASQNTSMLKEASEGGLGSDQTVRDTMDALLGHPAFPDTSLGSTESDWRPAAARGDVVLQSAGTNEVYLRGSMGSRVRAWYEPKGELPQDALPMDAFDDIVQAMN